MKITALVTGRQSIPEVTIDPTPEHIDAIVRRLEWKPITIVTAEQNPGVFVECSGAVEDGFSVIYGDGAEQFIGERAPESIDEMVLILQDFATGGTKWKDLFEWHPYGKVQGPKRLPDRRGSGCATLLVLVSVVVLIATIAA